MPAPQAIKRGSDEPLLQFWETTATITQGVNSVIEYKGINLAKMSSKAAVFANAGWDSKLRFEHDVATLTLTRATATIPGNPTSPFQDVIDKWELALSNEKPELFENETFIQAATSVDVIYGTNVGEQIFQCVRSTASSSNATWADFWANAKQTTIKDAAGNDVVSSVKLNTAITAIASVSGTYYNNLRLFVMDYLRGQTNFLRGERTLRHTLSAPSDYAENIADFNVEKIYTIAQLLSEAQSGTLWNFPLPGYLAYKILNLTVPSYLQENRMWGALKTGSSAVTTARARVEIATEYLIGAAPKHTYGLAT